MSERLAIPKYWSFQAADVARTFDVHVREQLPWYDLATAAIAFLARYYIQFDTRVYDLGCATGNVGRAIASTLTDRCASLTAIDNSAEMLEQYSAPGIATLGDIETYEYEPYSLAVSFLTIQFVPVSRRAALLERLLSRALPGGVLIILERWLSGAGADADADAALYRLTLDAKLRAGASAEEIMTKELSLVGVQRPLDPTLLQSQRYRVTEVFRFGHFASYILTIR